MIISRSIHERAHLILMMTFKVGIIVIPILQVRYLGLRNTKQLAQAYVVQWPSCHLKPGSLSLTCAMAPHKTVFYNKFHSFIR